MNASDHPLYRSYLYVPGHRPDLIAKAYASIADAVVLDLEDSVPMDRKAEARTNAADTLSSPTLKPTFVRVNPLDSGLGAHDIIAVGSPHLTGIRLPKCEHTDDVRKAEWLLDHGGCDARVDLLLETARAVESAAQLATASVRVGMVGLGEADLMVDLRSESESSTMDAARAKVIIASRAVGKVSPAQSVFPQVRDLEGLHRTTVHGRRLGFVGRMAIHPDQLPIIHQIHTPAADEVAEAREICEAAADAASRSATIIVTAKGRMVGPPIVAKARQTLSLAEGLDNVCSAGAA